MGEWGEGVWVVMMATVKGGGWRVRWAKWQMRCVVVLLEKSRVMVMVVPWMSNNSTNVHAQQT